MSKKQLLILWIIAGSLTAALAIVRTNLSKSPNPVTKFHRGDLLAADLKPSAVAKIIVSDQDHTTTIVKGESAWTLAERQNFPVNFSKLTKAITELREIKIAHALEAGPSYNPRFGMDESSTIALDHGTKVRFLDSGDQELFSMTLGKGASGQAQANPMGMMSRPPTGGRYVRSSTDPGSVYVIASQLSEFSALPAAWLADEFFRIEGIKSITLSTPGDTEAALWTASRETDEAEMALVGLTDGEEMISAAASGLKNVFANARFEDVTTSELVTAEGDASKMQQAVIDTVEGFRYTLNLTPKKSAAEADGNTFNPSAENYFLTYTVTAEFPDVRLKPEGESDENAKAADAAFTTRLTTLKDKLAKEQKLQERAYEIAKWGTNALLKTREELAQIKGAAAAPPAMPSIPGFPPQPFQVPMALPGQ
jgi:hypothetical protein